MEDKYWIWKYSKKPVSLWEINRWRAGVGWQDLWVCRDYIFGTTVNGGLRVTTDLELSKIFENLGGEKAEVIMGNSLWWKVTTFEQI